MTVIGIEIKIRLLMLKKTQRALVDELKVRGFCVDRPFVSETISGRIVTPKSKEVLKEINNILDEWEKEVEK